MKNRDPGPTSRSSDFNPGVEPRNLFICPINAVWRHLYNSLTDHLPDLRLHLYWQVVQIIRWFWILGNDLTYTTQICILRNLLLLFAGLLFEIMPLLRGYYSYNMILLFSLSPLAFSFHGQTLLLFLPRVWFSDPSLSCIATSRNQLQAMDILRGEVVFQMGPSTLSVWALTCGAVVTSLESNFTCITLAIDDTVLFHFFFKPIIIDDSVGLGARCPLPVRSSIGIP